MTPEERYEKSHRHYLRHREKRIEEARDWNRRFPEKVRARMIKWRRIQWAKHLVAQLRARAAKRGLEFDLTPELLLERFKRQNGLCYWFGVPMVASMEERGPFRP